MLLEMLLGTSLSRGGVLVALVLIATTILYRSRTKKPISEKSSGPTTARSDIDEALQSRFNAASKHFSALVDEANTTVKNCLQSVPSLSGIPLDSRWGVLVPVSTIALWSLQARQQGTLHSVDRAVAV